MGQAVIEISNTLLAELLRLPKGTHINPIIQTASDLLDDRFKIYVTHPDLPEIPEGERYPVVANPEYRVNEQNRVEFTSWGITTWKFEPEQVKEEFRVFLNGGQSDQPKTE